MTSPVTTPDATVTETLEELVSVPTACIATRTRSAEARAVVATVSTMIDRGVSPSDITIVVRDADTYEAPLHRAARRYAVTLSVWTQLRLKRTIPYRLAVAIVDLLAAREETGGGSLTADALLDPLRFEWVPADGSGSRSDGPKDESEEVPGSLSWPIEPSVIDAFARVVEGESRTIAGWRERCGAVGGTSGAQLTAYLDWIDRQPASAAPRDIPTTLGPVIDAYRTVVMPRRREKDDPTLSDTATNARALARMEALTLELAEKYDEWLRDGYGDRSWTTVATLLDALASTIPGRREYATARSVDVMEANDVWGLDLPYVITAGLVDGEWPRPPESVFPAALRETLRHNEGAAALLRPRSGWTEWGELDQFADTVGAASQGLICTRFTTDGDGVGVRPSPYVEALDPEPVGSTALEMLVGEAEELPNPIAAMLTASDSADARDTEDSGGGPHA